MHRKYKPGPKKISYLQDVIGNRIESMVDAKGIEGIGGDSETSMSLHFCITLACGIVLMMFHIFKNE